MSESLYFIAIVPDEAEQARIHELKLEMEQKFESRHAQNAPAHITLHMPFRWKDTKKEVLLEMMHRINATVKTFTIALDGFDFFEPRVVFVRVVSNDVLHSLQKMVQQECRATLKKVNANYRDQVFHPHVTIGFRDLKKAQFHLAKAYYSERNFSSSFDVSKVHLLRHDGARWQIEEC
jgi:2'-5' RNA ligase